LYLFDASSIVNLVKRGLVRVFEYGATVDLALYEALNAVWKESKLLGRFDEETALEFIEILAGIFEAIRVFNIRGLEEEVLRLASREDLTIYDASYLYMAIKNRSILVTDDRKLRDKASKYVEAISSSQLASRHLGGGDPKS